MRKSRVILNEKYNMLTPIKDLGMKIQNNRNRHFFLCKCDCGKLVEIRADQIGKNISCGCDKLKNVSRTSKKRHLSNRQQLLLEHGINSKKITFEDIQRLRTIWTGIKHRCNNINDDRYDNYGGRGIKICDEWKNDLYNFIKWALNNGYEEGLSIDRINNNGNYEPNNCRWADNITQCRNRGTNINVKYKNKLITLKELSEITGISYSCLHVRYVAGDRGERLIRPMGIGRQTARGSKNVNAKIDEEQAKQIKIMLKQGIPQIKIAQKFNVSKYLIFDIKRNKTWAHIKV